MTIETKKVPQSEIAADCEVKRYEVTNDDRKYICPQTPEFIIRPLGDRVIVRRIEEDEKTAGGIYIPTQAKEKPLEGRVLAVGEGRYLENGALIPAPVAVGDRVLFSKYAGSEVRVQGEDLLILNIGDIHGVYQWEPELAPTVDFPTTDVVPEFTDCSLQGLDIHGAEKPEE